MSVGREPVEKATQAGRGSQSALSSEAARADRFVARVMIACGILVGGLFGLAVAPHLQWRLRRFGVDPFAVGPAMVIIALCAALSGVFAWQVWRLKRR